MSATHQKNLEDFDFRLVPRVSANFFIDSDSHSYSSEQSLESHPWYHFYILGHPCHCSCLWCQRCLLARRARFMIKLGHWITIWPSQAGQYICISYFACSTIGQSDERACRRQRRTLDNASPTCADHWCRQIHFLLSLIHTEIYLVRHNLWPF